MLAHVTINSTRSKFDFLVQGINGNIDILMASETKLIILSNQCIFIKRL